jgi:spore maturation protein CgeB
MKLVVFGLTVSSSWENGHAALWRGLINALERRGHDVVFFERDTPHYAQNRDLTDLGEADLVLYSDWADVRVKAMAHLLDADAAMVTSYCPDAQAACNLVREHAHVSVFYDLDTPATLARLAQGEMVDYVPSDGLRDFDLVLSCTGGEALTQLEQRLGARRALPFYGHVDPDAYRPAPIDARYACDLSYLSAYAADRQAGVQTLFVEPARRRQDKTFMLGGLGYPQNLGWTDNIRVTPQPPPADRPAVYSSSRLTLNLARRDVTASGWCPSARLFEAAACGAAILSDPWSGLDHFFTPGREILTASTVEEAVAAIDMAPDALRAIGRAARERVLDEHTSDHRAGELLAMLADLVEGVLPVDVPHADARTLALAPTA